MPNPASLSFLLRAATIACALMLGACATRTPAPVVERQALPPPKPPVVAPARTAPPVAESEARPPSYTVKRGDTLYQIALDQGLDYRDLVAWNALDNPNLILVGQVLRLSPPGDNAGSGGVTTAPLRTVPPVGAASGAPAPAPAPATGPRNADNYKASPKAVKEPYSEQNAQSIAKAAATPDPPPAPVVARADPAPRAAPSPPPATGGDADKLDWVWPAQGKVVAGFSDTANLKGIDIAGAAGSPVVASAAGKVVYSGSGLRGYGKLVIIKHNETYLSAYAHNRDIAVKEGDQVARGQKIAEMGNSDADQVKLHFEIRRLGKPMDPLRYLPPA